MSETIENYPWNGMFQTKAEIDAYLSGDRIICLLCGKSYRGLGTHLRLTHDMTVDDYKTRYGLPWVRGLTSAITRSTMSQQMKQKHAAGVITAGITEEQRARLRLDPPKRRPMIPATRHAVINEVLKIPSRERVWKSHHYDEYLRRLGTGRTIMEVGRDIDMPNNYLFHEYCRENTKFRHRFEEVWDSVPFPVQIRGQNTSHRFRETLVMFREVLHYTWPKIADAMDIKESTARTAYHVLKHSSKLEEYRARVQHRLQTQDLL